MQQDERFYRLAKGGRNTAIGIWYGSLVGVIGAIVLLIWGTTQWVAWKLHFAGGLSRQILFALGPEGRDLANMACWALALAGTAFLYTPRTRKLSALAGFGSLVLFALSLGPLYGPFSFFLWALRFREVASLQPIFNEGFYLIAVPAHFLFLISVALTIHRSRKIGGQSDTHGSASFATTADIERSDFFSAHGVVLGGWDDGKRVRYLKDGGPSHTCIFAPSRSGKGVSVVVPTALSWRHSAIILDPKGELWHLTAGWRRNELGQHCLQFNPTNIEGSAARFNPMLEVRLGPYEVRDAQQLAGVLADAEDQPEDPHWRGTAVDLLVGCILHCLYAERDKSLGGVLSLIANPNRPLAATLQRMLETKHDPKGERSWVDPMTGEPTLVHPTIAKVARALLNKSENERTSVVSTMQRFLSLWLDPIVCQNTITSDFTISDLVNTERGTSLYLSIPSSDLVRLRPLIRMLFALVLRRLTERMEFDTPDGANHRLLLLLDEFSKLGAIREIEDSISDIAGFGIKALIVLQDLTQVYKHFGRNQGILGNCDILATFSTRNLDTAKLISEMLGSRTVHKEQQTITGSRFSPLLSHVMASEQETQRALLTPDEVTRLPEDTTLIFGGMKPIAGVKTPYYLDKEFRRRSALPPPAKSDLMEHDWSHLPVPSKPEVQPEPAEELPEKKRDSSDDVGLLLQDLSVEPEVKDGDSVGLI